MFRELDEAYEKMGTENEILYKPIIKSIYGDVIKTSHHYSRIDFIGDNYKGELKSRNLSINQYNETMIGYNKIETAFKLLKSKPTNKFYFWFAFKEGLYVWELTNETFELNGGIKQKRYAGTNNRGIDDYKDHYYIKTELLTKINNTPVWIHPLVENNTNSSKKIPTGICLLKTKKRI